MSAFWGNSGHHPQLLALNASTQGKYTKSQTGSKNPNNFNTEKSISQILPPRPAFLTAEAVTGNDIGAETRVRALTREALRAEPPTTNLRSGVLISSAAPVFGNCRVVYTAFTRLQKSFHIRSGS
jgi:hypothetical protein